MLTSNIGHDAQTWELRNVQLFKYANAINYANEQLLPLGLQLYFDFQNFRVGLPLPVSPYRMQF